MDWAVLQWTLLLAQADVMNHNDQFRTHFNYYLEQFASNLPVWLLFDQYERIFPSPDGPAFYEALEWLHGDDPWVAQAVKDARQRNASSKPVDSDQVLKALNDLPADRWPARIHPTSIEPQRISPWQVAAAVHQLRTSNPDKARQIALRYYAYAMRSYFPGCRVFANHLIHRLEQENPRSSF